MSMFLCVFTAQNMTFSLTCSTIHQTVNTKLNTAPCLSQYHTNWAYV